MRVYSKNFLVLKGKPANELIFAHQCKYFPFQWREMLPLLVFKNLSRSCCLVQQPLMRMPTSQKRCLSRGGKVKYILCTFDRIRIQCSALLDFIFLDYNHSEQGVVSCMLPEYTLTFLTCTSVDKHSSIKTILPPSLFQSSLN